MVSVFVDTGACLSLYDRKDQNHQKAKEAAIHLKDGKVPLITTDYVFDETVTIIRMRVGHKEAVNFGNSLLKSKIVKMVEINDDLKKEAWNIFIKYKDHRFSYTDCTSFAVLIQMKIERVFGYDKHFESMHFTLLP
jgi:predicted nucleic acid-binding protein